MPKINFCPGSANISGTPTLKAKACPECGMEIEIFSNEPNTSCKCGFIAYNDIQSCIKWCKVARECVGDEMYDILMANESEEPNETEETADSEAII